ncbi:MAG: 16S rRNA (cytosine(967)-C(5))-methyltransferase RsmB [Fusobacteriaceae bacterium]
MSVKLKGIEVLKEYRNGKYSNIALDEFFKKNILTKGEKNFLTEIFYGVIRNEILLDYLINKRIKEIKKDWLRELLRISFYQMTFMESDETGIVWEATELAKKKFGEAIGKFINGVLRSYQRSKSDDMKELRDKNQLDILYSCPLWFYELAQKKYAENTEKFLMSMKKIPYTSFRVNTLKYSEQEFESLIMKNKINIIKKVETVYYLDSGIFLSSEEFKSGKIFVQDASSFLCAKILDPKPNDSVIDSCSAPGGKAVAMAELMNNQGEILAFDIYPHKLKLIEDNAKKTGSTIIKPIKMDARKLVFQGKKFDKILIDAPCSGYGVLRKKPEILYSKKQENILTLADLQYEILTAGAEVLKVGGELVYSTCTIMDEENTENIARFLGEHKNFEPVKIFMPENIGGQYDRLGGFQIDYTEEILDSFYIIKLVKKS